MSRPLLIGSYAAQLRGILPAWRRGMTRDIDLVATPETAKRLAALWGARYHEHAPGRCYLSGRIDIDLRGELINPVLPWCEAVDARINGVVIPLLLPLPALIVAIRRATLDSVLAARTKALADLADFERAGIAVGAALLMRAGAFRKPNCDGGNSPPSTLQSTPKETMNA